jgi:hypothetical protein
MMTLSNVASRRLAWTRGLVVTSGFDQAGTTEGNDLANLRAASELPPMTPETARQLAALLAPHLAAMRAVTAGTPYESGAPATKIFIAGMLDRISA